MWGRWGLTNDPGLQSPRLGCAAAGTLAPHLPDPAAPHPRVAAGAHSAPANHGTPLQGGVRGNACPSQVEQSQTLPGGGQRTPEPGGDSA